VEGRHLRYFVAVAEELNYGRAAARLHVAQPGLSQQIKALEAELGVRLFDRTKRRVSLTQAGSLLLAEAYGVLSRFDHCLETMRRARAETRRAEVRLAMWSEFSRTWGPPLVAEIRRRNPELSLAVEALPSAATVRAVEVGELELGVVRSIPDRSPLARRLLATEPLGACLPTDHPCADGKIVRPERLSGEPLMWMPRSSNPELYDRALSALAVAGLRAPFVESTGTTTATFALVADGYGWCLCCEAEVADAATTLPLVWLPLSGVELIAETWAVWSADQASPVAAEVLDVLSDIVSGAHGSRP
jgi:DNA-binding transcriptional LysR family regulator